MIPIVSIPVDSRVIELLAVQVPVQPLYGHPHLNGADDEERDEHHGKLHEVDVRQGHERLRGGELVIGVHNYVCGKAGQ